MVADNFDRLMPAANGAFHRGGPAGGGPIACEGKIADGRLLCGAEIIDARLDRKDGRRLGNHSAMEQLRLADLRPDCLQLTAYLGHPCPVFSLRQSMRSADDNLAVF